MRDATETTSRSLDHDLSHGSSASCLAVFLSSGRPYSIPLINQKKPLVLTLQNKLTLLENRNRWYLHAHNPPSRASKELSKIVGR